MAENTNPRTVFDHGLHGRIFTTQGEAAARQYRIDCGVESTTEEILEEEKQIPVEEEESTADELEEIDDDADGDSTDEESNDVEEEEVTAVEEKSVSKPAVAKKAKWKGKKKG